MRFHVALLLLSLMPIPGCDLTGGPNNVQRKTEAQVCQYFPNAHAFVLREQGTILAVTCTHGLGKRLIEEMATHVASEHGIQQLHEARQLPMKLSPYRFFIIQFEEYSIRLDTDTQQHWILPSDAQERLRYNMLCSSK
jgi:hypothetical protein